MTERIHTLPHFSPEEVQALQAEHDRRAQVVTGRGAYSADEERIRDAIQRTSFWRAQPESEHRDEELAHCLFTLGRIDEALILAKNLERRAWYETIHNAITKDDGCECETPDHVVGHFPSPKHSGRMMPIRQCPECKQMNIG